MLRSCICKNVLSHLNIRKCVATLRDMFSACFSMKHAFLIITKGELNDAKSNSMPQMWRNLSNW